MKKLCCAVGKLAKELREEGFLNETDLEYIEKSIEDGEASMAFAVLDANYDSEILLGDVYYWSDVSSQTTVIIEIPDEYFGKKSHKSVWG